MKKVSALLAALVSAAMITACAMPVADAPPPVSQPETTSLPQTTLPQATTQPPHSELYIPQLNAEDVILYFNEVCLAAEYINSGDPSVLQKWEVPIVYTVLGAPTQEDLDTLRSFAEWLSGVEGFPGIRETQDPSQANLRIHICSQEELLLLMGEDFRDSDGAVTFWYQDDAIYDAIICCRTDLDQTLRNSVILEELYNALGPIQDTALRPDSIIYAEFSQPQSLTDIDELILQLLYHPQMKCGMSLRECETVIRELYY